MDQLNKEAVMPNKSEKAHGMFYKSLLFLGIALAVVLALWIVKTQVFSSYSKGYQAVFLSNGQVYFGHLERNIGRDYLKLTNVYYLQLDQELQAGGEATETNPQFNLVKLGNEIHGPKDMMLINKDHVLFIEDLQEDSEVVQVISAQ